MWRNAITTITTCFLLGAYRGPRLRVGVLRSGRSAAAAGAVGLGLRLGPVHAVPRRPGAPARSGLWRLRVVAPVLATCIHAGSLRSPFAADPRHHVHALDRRPQRPVAQPAHARRARAEHPLLCARGERCARPRMGVPLRGDRVVACSPHQARDGVAGAERRGAV
jgi:hypothetical protein